MPECSELTTNKLDHISGVVCITHPPEPCFDLGAGSATGGVGGVSGLGAGKIDLSAFSINY
jgi:hypothetical protein